MWKWKWCAIVQPCAMIQSSNHIRQTVHHFTHQLNINIYCLLNIIHQLYNSYHLCVNILIIIIKLNSMSNYKEMYEDKCKQCEQLNAQFNQYQQHSNFIITDLQQQVKQLKKKNEVVSRQHAELKERRKTNTISLEKQIQLAKKQREQFKNKFVEFEKKVIQLQNINQSQQSDLRATRATLHEYEQRIEKTMEELALLQIQMQQSTENNQEQIARLRSQLKQTEDELYALHHAKNKNDNGNKQNENKNMNESFNSKQSQNQVRISQSKIRRKNTKFSETLTQIREYIKQITSRRQKLSIKFEQLI